MDEIGAETGLEDHASRHLVHLPACRVAPRDRRFLDELQGGVAGLTDDFPDPVIAFGDAFGHDADPCDVGVNSAGLLQLAPDVDKDQISGLYGGAACFRRIIVRLRGMSADGDDGRMVRFEAHLLHPLPEVLLEGPFVESAAGADPTSDHLPGLIHNRP